MICLAEKIWRRTFEESDCAEAQERVIAEVESSTEEILARYKADPRSHDGRFVNADLMKEMFTYYHASPYARARYNIAIHNSAAVLAAEQYRRAVEDASNPARTNALFVTGTPGAGKSTAYSHRIPEDARVVFEGSLVNPEAITKIQQAIDAGTKVEITVIHVTPEQALDNTLRRFAEIGRGASAETMARIQGGLPDALDVIYARFGETISLTVMDRTETDSLDMPAAWRWEDLSEEEGARKMADRNALWLAEMKRQYAPLNSKEWHDYAQKRMADLNTTPAPF